MSEVKPGALSSVARHYGYPCLVSSVLAGVIGTLIGFQMCGGYAIVPRAARMILPGVALVYVLMIYRRDRKAARGFGTWAAMTCVMFVGLYLGEALAMVFWPDWPTSFEDAIERFTYVVRYGMC